MDDLLPEIITPQSLSLERHWYLFNNMRDLVSDITKADDVAPLPKEKLVKKTKEDKNLDRLGLENKNEMAKQKKESTSKELV